MAAEVRTFRKGEMKKIYKEYFDRDKPWSM